MRNGVKTEEAEEGMMKRFLFSVTRSDQARATYSSRLLLLCISLRRQTLSKERVY